MTDSRYQDYLDRITALNESVTQGDNNSKSMQRRFKAERDQLISGYESKISSLQGNARKLASDYIHAANQLKARDLSSVGVRLPDRVRPSVVERGNLPDFISAQKNAEASLMSAITMYRKGVENANAEEEALRKALEARRKAHSERQKTEPVELPPTPVLEDRNSDSNQLRKNVSYIVAITTLLLSVIIGVLLNQVLIGTVVGIIVAALSIVIIGKSKSAPKRRTPAPGTTDEMRK